MMNAAVEQLVRLAHPEGGWGYTTGQPMHLEPTCLAMLALNINDHRALLEKALLALELQADGTGLYRLTRGRPQAIWPTAMVLFVQTIFGQTTVDRTAQRLLAVRGKTISGDPEVSNMMDINSERVGWPWAEGTFSWAEPTAWAVFALRAAGQATHPRVIEGAKLLLDRAFPDGGINYGNRKVLGAMTEPIPGPTAIMLLALQGSEHPLVQAACRYLLEAVRQTNDLDHLGWAKLALAANNVPPDQLAVLDQRITASYAAQLADGRPISVVRHALTALALNTASRNPFKLTGQKATPIPADGDAVPPAKMEDPPKPGLFEKVKSKFRNVLIRGLGALREPPEFGGVHIGLAESYDVDLLAVLQQQFTAYRPHVPLQGKRVVLKPNLVEFRSAAVINTDPRFIDAVIQLCKAEGAAEIVVAEGPGHWRNVEFLVEESGLGPILRKHGVRFVDLNHDEPVKVPNLGRLTGLEFLYLTRTILSADVFISLPKMKTHHWAVATLSLKNLFGTMPGLCYGWPKNELHWRGIPNSIIDINLTHTPHLAIVDGIMAMEGDGPLVGNAVPMGVIVMGADLVAVDATCCRLMQLPVERIPTLILGHETKLGRLLEADIPQLGASIASRAKPFLPPPNIAQILAPMP